MSRADRVIDPRELADLTASLGFAPEEAVCRNLAAYLELLMRWNRVMNLTGARTWQDALRTLAIDSLHLASFLESLPLPAAPLCWDPGAGAGLPGIPLRLIWDRGEYWMIESREKRALFLSTVLARIPLPGVHVHRGRLERFMADHPAGRGPVDLVLSRAFMPWKKLLALVGGRLAPSGLVVLLLNAPLLPFEKGCSWRVRASLAYTAGDAGRTLCALERTPE